MMEIVQFYQVILMATMFAHGMVLGAKEFPMEKFFKQDDKAFLSKYKSEYVCGKNMSPGWKCCSCEPSCLLYGNCCVDYLWQRENGSFATMTDYEDYMIKENKRNRNLLMNCQYSITVLDVNPYLSKSYWMISDCPIKDVKEDHDRNFCQKGSLSTEDSLVVLGDDGFLYQNSYCASCNQVKKYQIVQLTNECESEKPSFSSCIVDLNATATKKTRNTTSKVLKHKKFHFEKCMDFETSCENEKVEKRIYDLCHSFVGPIDVGGNFFCEICASTSFFKMTRMVDNRLCRDWNWKRLPTQFTYTTELKFHHLTTEDSCSSYTLDDILTGKCTSLLCQQDYIAIEGECHRFESKQAGAINFVNNEIYDQCFHKSIKFFSLYMEGITKRNLKDLSKYFDIDEISAVSSKGIVKIPMDAFDFSNEENRHHFLSKIIHVTQDLSEDATFILGPNFPKYENVLLDPKYSFSGDRICVNPRPLSHDFFLKYNCDVVGRKTGDVMTTDNLTQWIEIRRYSITRNLYTCSKFMPPCELQVLDSRFTMIDDQILYYNKDGKAKVYQYGSYVPLRNQDFVVCKDLTYTPSWYLSIYSFEKYTQLIGSIISFLCYVFFMTSYNLMPGLRNSTMYCLLVKIIFLLFQDTLSFIMLFVQIIQVAHFSTGPCSVLSTILYFCFISDQIWTAIFPAAIMNSKFLKKSFLVGFTLLISILLTTVFLVLTQLKILILDYGESNLCTIQFSPALVIFHITPLLFSVSCAITCFIRSFKKQSHSSLDEKKHGLSMVALMVIVLCGVGEGLGFARKRHLTDEGMLIIDAVIRVLCSILKGLRGVWVLLILRKHMMDTYQKHKANIRKNALKIRAKATYE